MRPQHLAAAAMTAAATLAVAGFTALGSLFDYPAILKEPTADVVGAYAAHQGSISAWFGVLALGALMLVPMAIGVARLAADARRGRVVVAVGIAAAGVQAIGLSRWFLLVPSISADAQVAATRADALNRFEAVHLWLGTVLGETVGYVLTATLTVLVVRALPAGLLPTWVSRLGLACALLVATGVAAPFLHVATLTNFLGYVGWSAWLLVTAGVLTFSAAGRRAVATAVPA